MPNGHAAHALLVEPATQPPSKDGIARPIEITVGAAMVDGASVLSAAIIEYRETGMISAATKATAAERLSRLAGIGYVRVVRAGKPTELVEDSDPAWITPRPEPWGSTWIALRDRLILRPPQ